MARQIATSHSARLYRRIVAFVVGASLAVYYGIFGGGFDPDPRGFAAIVVWSVVAVGLATGLFPRTRLPGGWQIAAALLAGLAAWTALSIAWSDSAEKSYIEVTRALHYGGIVALAWLTLDRHTWSAAAAGVFFGAIAITALALTSRLIPDAFPTPDPVLVGRDPDRLEYPFGYWNALGAWASMTTALALAWAAHARLVIFRIGAAAAIPIAGSVVYLTYSRGSVVGFAVGVVVTVLASRRRWSAGLIAAGGIAGTGIAILAIRDQPQIAEGLGSAGAGTVALGIAAGAALAAIVVLAVIALGVDRWRAGEEFARSVAAVALTTVAMVAIGAFASGFVGEIWDRVGSDPQTASSEPASDPAQGDTGERLTGLESSRSDIYDSALDAYSTAPLLGIGAGNFEFWWARNATTLEYMVDAHSLYVESLAELGPIGLTLVVGVLGWLGFMVLATRARTGSTRRAGAAAGALGALAVFAVQAGIDWFWEYAALSALAIGSAAIAACGRSGARKRAALPRGTGLGLAVVAVAMVLIQLPPWLSIRSVRASEDALAAGDSRAAIDRAQDAVSVQSWGARPHVQLARARAVAGELSAAAQELREAIDREPTNWRHRAQLAGVEQARGNLEAAEVAKNHALRLYKFRPATVDFVVAEMFQLAS